MRFPARPAILSPTMSTHLSHHSLAAAAFFLLLTGSTGSASAENATPPSTLPADANTTCPVMTAEPADPELYVDHEGRRVYLCCTKCKRLFRNNPDKYLKNLPPAPAAGKTSSRDAATSAGRTS